MVKNNEFCEIGKLVGLKREEIKEAVPRKWVYLVLASIIIIVLLITGISGILLYAKHPDPYVQGTLYGTIEPRFVKRIRKKVSKHKMNL